MAFVSQELKKKLSPKIKQICQKYGVKASLGVRNHRTLVLNIKQGGIDFIGNINATLAQRPSGHRNNGPAQGSIQINPYWYHEHFSGIALDFLKEIVPAMKGPDYFDHSDAQTDYFHCSHYFDINVGRWDRPYILQK